MLDESCSLLEKLQSLDSLNNIIVERIYLPPLRELSDKSLKHLESLKKEYNLN